jgi:glycosyltransferase involved in cell wall biosynthesis
MPLSRSGCVGKVMRVEACVEPMRILHIITRLIVGGAQQNTVLCCEDQVSHGHAVWLAFGPIYGPEGSMRDAGMASGAELVEVKSMRRAVLPGHDYLCYRALRRLIRRVRPEVVHTHSSKAGIVGRAAAWAERVPAVVHTVHGLPFHGRQPWHVHRTYVALERWAARRCHHLIAITPAMVDAFVAARIATADRFTVIPSGIVLDDWQHHPTQRGHVRRELNMPPDAPLLALVARLDPLKGHDDVLDVLPQLLTRWPEMRVLFIGDGWNRRTIELRIAREGLGGRVIVTGLVSQAEVARLLSACDVKVLPSYQEGQSRTLVEALLCGCGVVGYDVGGIGAIIEDGRTGRLVPVGDRVRLGEVIAWMIEYPAERARLVRQGRMRVRERFDARTMVDRVMDVYIDVLAGRKGGRR